MWSQANLTLDECGQECTNRLEGIRADDGDIPEGTNTIDGPICGWKPTSSDRGLCNIVPGRVQIAYGGTGWWSNGQKLTKCPYPKND